MSQMGQSATPIVVAGMEELASIPDADEANCWPASGGRNYRRPAASPRRRVFPNKPSRPSAVASETGQLLPFSAPFLVREGGVRFNRELSARRAEVL